MMERGTVPSSVSNPFFDLPEDIIENILSLLPVKTLIRLRCVCKSWLCLISNPNFIKTHLKKSSLSNNRLLFSDYDFNYDLNVGSYFVKSLSDNDDIVVLDYPTTKSHCSVSFVGSCNGLVCIAIKSVGIFVWNPSTRISKKLPHSDIHFTLDMNTFYGFGYDHLSDDYKVVWIRNAVFMYFERKKEVKVFSLKSGSWGEIEGFPHILRKDEMGKYVNGVLHWKVRTNNVIINSLMIIVSLDLRNETYGEIPQLCYDECDVSYMDLGVLEECLSINRFFKHKHKVDIWVMKEYGVKDSWIKLYAIVYGVGSEYCYLTPLCISVTGEILMNSGGRLVLYNPTTDKFRNPEVSKLTDGIYYLNAITYVESLVSPNTDDEVPSLQN